MKGKIKQSHWYIPPLTSFRKTTTKQAINMREVKHMYIANDDCQYNGNRPVYITFQFGNLDISVGYNNLRDAEEEFDCLTNILH